MNLLKTLLLAVLVVVPGVLSAQTVPSTTTDIDPVWANRCKVDVYVGYRSRDLDTKGQVSRVQNFLIEKGYLSGRTTGFYGDATRTAMGNFQIATNLATSTTSIGFGNAGPLTRAKINSMICSGTITTTPAITLTSTPSLTLSYLNGSEAQLVGTVNARVRAGGTTLYGPQPLLVSLLDSKGVTAPATISMTAAGGIPQAIQPGQEISYTVEVKANPKQLFAGQYSLSVAPLVVTSTFNQEKADVGGTRTSNAVTITGEVSPYITNITADATPKVNVSITGVRFHPTSNTVTVGTITKTLPSLNNGTLINFTMSEFGITQAGYYQVQIKHPTAGASNIVRVQSGGLNSSTNPKLTVLGTPNLALTYGGTDGKSESLLTGTFNATLTASSGAALSPQVDYPPLHWRLKNITTGQSTDVVTKLSMSVKGGAPSVILPGQSVDYAVQFSVDPKQLFAGQYQFDVTSFISLGTGASFVNADISGTVSSNIVRIIGEVSPYITSALQGVGDPPVLSIKGVRFAPVGNIVTIGDKTLTLDSKAFINYDEIVIDITRLGIASGNYAVKVKHPTTGASNTVSVQVNAPVSVESAPKIEVVGTPTMVLTYSWGSEAQLVATVNAKVTAGGSSLALDANAFNSPILVWFIDGSGQRSNLSTTVSSSALGGMPTLLTPGQSATYTIQFKQNPKQMFAGQYNIQVRPELIANGQLISATLSGFAASNKVTITGEVSPYITNITADATPKVNVSITGVRFHPTSNTVTVGTITKTLPSLNNGTLINFTMSEFGITQAGYYQVQIKHPTAGASNMVTMLSNGVTFAASSGSGQTASVVGAFERSAPEVTPAVSPQTPKFSYTWNTNLQIGSSEAEDITALQTALQEEGVYSGEITSGFYNQTYLAVKAFQAKYGIEATGFVGPATRAKLNALYGNN